MRSSEPVRQRPQSSAGLSKKMSFLGRLQIPKRTGAAQSPESAPAAATRKAGSGSNPLGAHALAVDAGAAGLAHVQPVLECGSGAQYSLSGVGTATLARSDGTGGAATAAEPGETPESDTVDAADVSWAVTLPPRPPQQRPASVPLLRMDWGRKTASPSEGDCVPVL